MSHSQFHSDTFILRHAWLNLWDERMTTGRINQVAASPCVLCIMHSSHWLSPSNTSPWMQSASTQLWLASLNSTFPVPPHYSNDWQCVGIIAYNPSIQATSHSCILGTHLTTLVVWWSLHAKAFRRHSGPQETHTHWSALHLNKTTFPPKRECLFTEPYQWTGCSLLIHLSFLSPTAGLK